MNVKKSLLIAMAKADLNRKDVCERAKVTNSYLTLIMQNAISPKLSTTQRIASSFDMTVSEFIALGEE